MVKIVLLALVVMVAVILLAAALKPNTFRVQRAALIKAPPDKIFPFLNDFHKWDAWSPFEKLDPAMKKNFSGTASGKGAIYAWDGNAKAGQGRMEITDTAPGSKVVIQLDFIKPMKTTNTTEFALEPQGDATKVQWTMFGTYPFIGKLMGLFFSMDKMVGKDFETGLANLKAMAEK